VVVEEVAWYQIPAAVIGPTRPRAWNDTPASGRMGNAQRFIITIPSLPLVATGGRCLSIGRMVLGLGRSLGESLLARMPG
jgi:hypothetical protein